MPGSLLLPLLFGCVWLLNGVNIGRFFSGILSYFIYIFFFFFLCVMFFEINTFSNEIHLVVVDWVVLGFWKLTLALHYDILNYSMFFLIFFISMFVMLYSWDYMEGDPLKGKFMGFLGLFTFFMLVLVKAGNLLLLFIGWEGVGLSSYLLISFWYTRLSAVKAAVKAMVVNRIGDVFLLAACIIVMLFFNSLDFLVLKGLLLYIFRLFNDVYIFFLDLRFLSVLGLFLFIGAMSKSAQLGLHTWLPDAMEGPTPVSALIHAATMVTAGVYLVLRFSFLYEYLFSVLLIIIVIGGLTALLPAFLGVFQYDIKKIVAYSTCSQLGYMFFSCGFSNYFVAFFHLVNHGFFKALLFLSMGSIIHALNDEQDLRRMGQNIVWLNFTYLVVFIGSIALLGIPFFAGYYSKDLLLELTVMRLHWLSSLVYIFGIMGAFFTAFYSTRLTLWVFFFKTNAYRKVYLNVHDSNNYLFIVLFSLGFISIVCGYFFVDSFVGAGSLFFFNSIHVTYLNYFFFDVEFGISVFFKFLPLFVSLLGIILYYLLCVKTKSMFLSFSEYSYKGENVLVVLYKRYFVHLNFFFFLYFFDNVYNKIFYYFMVYNYKFFFKFIEKGLFEWFGFGIAKVSVEFLNRLSSYVVSYLFFHLMFMTVFIVFCIFFQLFVGFGLNLLVLCFLILLNVVLLVFE